MLSEHRIQVVEFEYNSRVGYWHPRFQERRTLNTSLGLLGAAGYEFDAFMKWEEILHFCPTIEDLTVASLAIFS